MDKTTKNQQVGALQFPWKLHAILDEEESSNRAGNDVLISWLQGTAFQIHDKKKFAQVVMPKHFKTSTFKSFQRNLKLWGFQTITKGYDSGIYAHSYFVKGQPDLCHKMVRVSVKKKPQSPSPAVTPPPATAPRLWSTSIPAQHKQQCNPTPSSANNMNLQLLRKLVHSPPRVVPTTTSFQASQQAAAASNDSTLSAFLRLTTQQQPQQQPVQSRVPTSTVTSATAPSSAMTAVLVSRLLALEQSRRLLDDPQRRMFSHKPQIIEPPADQSWKQQQQQPCARHPVGPAANTILKPISPKKVLSKQPAALVTAKNEEAPKTKNHSSIRRDSPPAAAVDTPSEESVRKVQCRARGMPLSHNPHTAFLKITNNMPHGSDLPCSHEECRREGIKFRYCAHCDVPVAKRTIGAAHGHKEFSMEATEKKKKQTSNDKNTNSIQASLTVKQSTSMAITAGHKRPPFLNSAVLEPPMAKKLKAGARGSKSMELPLTKPPAPLSRRDLQQPMDNTPSSLLASKPLLLEAPRHLTMIKTPVNLEDSKIRPFSGNKTSSNRLQNASVPALSLEVLCRLAEGKTSVNLDDTRILNKPTSSASNTFMKSKTPNWKPQPIARQEEPSTCDRKMESWKAQHPRKSKNSMLPTTKIPTATQIMTSSFDRWAMRTNHKPSTSPTEQSSVSKLLPFKKRQTRHFVLSNPEDGSEEASMLQEGDASKMLLPQQKPDGKASKGIPPPIVEDPNHQENGQWEWDDLLKQRPQKDAAHEDMSSWMEKVMSVSARLQEGGQQEDVILVQPQPFVHVVPGVTNSSSHSSRPTFTGYISD